MRNTQWHPWAFFVAILGPTLTHANEPIDSQPFQGKLAVLPGTIEAEHFDEGSADVAYRDTDPVNQGAEYREPTEVDIESRADASNGHGLGWTKAGEWLVYSVEILQSGDYTLSIPVACDGQGGTFHFEIDDQPITKPLQIPDTGGWDKLETIRQDGIELPEGKHQLKLVMDSDGKQGSTGDIDKFDFELTENPVRLHGDGFDLTLLAVGCDDNVPNWWSPFGQPIQQQPYQNDRGGKVFAQGKPIQFVFLVDELNETDRLRFSVSGSRGQQTRNAETLDGQRVKVITAFVDPDKTTTDITVSRNAGSFRRAVRIEGDNPGAVSNGMAAMAVLPPIQDDDATLIHASIAISSDDVDFRLVAFDNRGQTHASDGRLRGGSTTAGQRTASIYEARFSSLATSDYAGVELQTRADEKYQVTGIPLNPGQRSDIQQVFTPAPPAAQANLDWNRVTLADWDDQTAEGHVLDLATGERLKWDASKEIDNQSLIFAAKKKGDLVWHKSLLALRGTTIELADGEDGLHADESVTGVKIYDDVPTGKPLLVTTPEGDRYILVVFETADTNKRQATYRYLSD